MCILSVYTLLKVVSYYDLSVLFMSAMGFQKKFGWGVHGWGELYPVLFGFVLTFQSPLPGPTPSTVFEPGAICVRPASRITLIVKPSALACSASCSLQRRRHVFRSRLKTSLQFRSCDRF